MNKVFLEKLILRNFKGSGEIELSFTNNCKIVGKNGAGKTRIVDAFNWLLHGKNAEDDAKFGIKSRDVNGNTTDMQDVEVEGILYLNELPIKLTRTLVEKWEVRDGDLHPTYKSDTTIYKYNGVRVPEKEYEARVNEIIISKALKLITNPLYFSGKLPWMERRDLLFSIVGSITDEEFISQNAKYAEFKGIITKSISYDFFKADIAGKIKKIKDAIKELPVRINEVNRSLKPVSSTKEELNAEIRAFREMIKSFEAQKVDTSKGNEAINALISKLQDEVLELETEVKKINQKAESDKNARIKIFADTKKELAKRIQEEEEIKPKCQGKIESLKSDIKAKEEEINRKREDYREEKIKELGEFDKNSFVCPTCKRKHDDEDIEATKVEMIKNFNEDKVKSLEKIAKEAEVLKLEVKRCVDDISENERLISQSQYSINLLRKSETTNDLNEVNAESPIENFLSPDDFNFLKTANESIVIAKAKIKEYKESKESQEPADNSQIQISIDSLTAKIEEANKQLTALEFNEQVETRVKELNAQLVANSQELSNLERTEWLLVEFMKDKVTAIESKVSELFGDSISFKLFDIRNNGGVKDVCEVLVNGVLFEDTNNAGKVQAGMKIINVLSKTFGVQAPIFIDNRESITVLPETESQTISLIVKDLPDLSDAIEL